MTAFFSRTSRLLGVGLAAAALVFMTAAPARAQAAPAAPADPNPGAITLTTGVDFPSVYFFRGIRQEADPAFTMFAYGDVGISLGKATVNFGVWNSLHSGTSGSDGPGPMHYEEDFYTSISFAAGKGLSIKPMFTAYTSPNGMFRTVKEISFTVSHASKFAPYANLAFELGGDDSGQADGGYLLPAGGNRGSYLELGIGPSWALGGGRATVAVPVKIGMSLSDYYEDPVTGQDNAFGFFDIGGLVTVPLSKVASNYGSWNFHVGLDVFALGSTTETLNNGESSQVIFSAGIGLSY
ncbi:MAG: hypothetical protein ND807_07875 [Vicinamibacterales bacterium]|nr:hypothetical protein [Vicinamibacterales bacterium]